MGELFNFYAFGQIGIIVLAIAAFIIWDKRYRKNHGAAIPPGFEKTDEVTLDPTDGRKLRVYYNSSTGERFYHEE
ncbi:MAG: hypothetical protein WCF96_08845 [Eubacteriales bacterium]